jgi:hypothetical protein
VLNVASVSLPDPAGRCLMALSLGLPGACVGIPAAFLTQELDGGGHICQCYQIYPFCDSTASIIIKATDGSGVLTLDPSPQVLGLLNDPCTVTMTISSFDAEGIVIEWKDNGGTTIWKATNREHWNPAVQTQLKVLTYDPTVESAASSIIHFPPNALLVPMIGCTLPDFPDPASCCGCEGVAAYAYLLTIDSFGNAATDSPVADCLEQICQAFAGSYFFVGCTGVMETTTGPKDVSVCTVDSPLAFSVRLGIVGGPDSTTVGVGGGLGSTLEGTAVVDMPFCEWVHSATSVTVNLTSGFCEGSTATVIPIAMNERGDPVDCEGNVIDLPRCPPRTPACRGGSTWKVARGCHLDDTWVYYWKLTANGCAGRCVGETSCNAVPPFVIDETPMNDATAAAYGSGNLIDMLDVEQAGTCECNATIYAPPICVCSGTSNWTLKRKDCGVLAIWYWLLNSSSCDGACCFPKPPFHVAEGLTGDGDATAAGYFTYLDVPTDSTCWCGEEYVTPDTDCSDCETCADNTTDKTFVLSGLTGGSAFYNGTYILLKSTTDSCDGLDCCWYGESDGEFPQHAVLSFSGTQWQLEFEPGEAIYLFTSTDPCLDSITLSLDAAPGGEGWPATITALSA